MKDCLVVQEMKKGVRYDKRKRIQKQVVFGDRGGRVEEIEYLLACGVSPSCLDYATNRTALAFTVVRKPGRMCETISLLLKHGANPNERSHSDGERTILQMAVIAGSLPAIKILLEFGADVNAESKGGMTALFWSCLLGQEEYVQELLAAGASIGTESENAGYAIHCAASGGSAGSIKLLLEAGANHSTKDKHGNRPLHYAARAGSKPAAEELLNAGANSNDVNDDGRVPLMEAAVHRKSEMYEILSEGFVFNERSFQLALAIHGAHKCEHLRSLLERVEPSSSDKSAMVEKFGAEAGRLILSRLLEFETKGRGRFSKI